MRVLFLGDVVSGAVDAGVTVEFWLKKPGWSLATTRKEVIFDLWNGDPALSPSYGRLRIEMTGSGVSSDGSPDSGRTTPFRFTVLSGAMHGVDTHNPTLISGAIDVPIGTGSLNTGSLENWHHYAFSFSNTGSSIVAKLFVDGV